MHPKTGQRLKGDLDTLVVEGVLEPASKDSNALTVVPQFVYMGEPIAVYPLRTDKSRNVSLFMTIHEPSKPANLEENPAVFFNFGRLAPEDRRKYPAANRLPEGTLNRWAHEANWFTLKLVKEKQPLTVSVMVTEHQEASEFLGFIAAVFGKAQEQITQELQTAIVPEKREAAAETNRQAKETADSTYEAAYAMAKQALDACAADNDSNQSQLARSQTARAKLRELNQAARATNRDNRVSDEEIGRISLTNEVAARQACTSLFQSLTL